MSEKAERRAFATVQNNFNDAVKAFNKNPTDTATLQRVLDPDVILFDITVGQVQAQGQAAVIQILQALAGAKFKPKQQTVIFWPPANPVKVSGVAHWTDNDGSPQDLIDFEFHFQPKTGLIISLWAN